MKFVDVMRIAWLFVFCSSFFQVLEVDITKDDKGKKVPEYFIHFNGWNRR